MFAEFECKTADEQIEYEQLHCDVEFWLIVD